MSENKRLSKTPSDNKVRLEELLENALACGCMNTDEVAEYLCDSGVIAPPCRVGDKVYEICEGIDDGIPSFVEELTVTEVGSARIFCSAYAPPRDDIHNEILLEELGTSVFLTRDEADSVLRERQEP